MECACKRKELSSYHRSVSKGQGNYIHVPFRSGRITVTKPIGFQITDT